MEGKTGQEYDRYGNMNCVQDSNTNGPCPRWTYNTSTNQVTTSGFTYDAAGSGAEALANSPPGKVRGQGTLDALMEAINWLQPPKPGASIFLFALDLKGRHHTRWSKVRNSAMRNRIRVFSFQLDQTTAHLPDPLDSFTTRQIESGAFAAGPGPNPVHLLADYTEGDVVVENTRHGGRNYKLTDDDGGHGDLDRGFHRYPHLTDLRGSDTRGRPARPPSGLHVFPNGIANIHQRFLWCRPL